MIFAIGTDVRPPFWASAARSGLISGTATIRGLVLKALPAMPPHPTVHLPLAHPGLSLPLARAADKLGYGLR